MNPTIEKFGYPATLVCELDQWVVLLRPAQVTLGSLVLAAKSDATAYRQLPPEVFVEQGRAVAAIEEVLTDFCAFERINYLMLMMVDPNVHFHVIPRYSGSRHWNGIEFSDAGWPGAPRLDAAVQLNEGQLHELAARLRQSFVIT